MNVTDVELEFDNFMFGIGFTKVSEDVGESPNFENADYIHKTEKIIIELKTIHKDFLEKVGFIDTLNTFVARPQKIDDKGLGLYEMNFPKTNREKTLDNIEEPIRRIIKKANGQLKKTKNYYFKNESSHCFILVAIIGIDSIPPIFVTQIIAKILNKEFSGVDGVIICKPYESTIENSNQIRETECHSITNENDKLKKIACKKIADEWVEFLKSGGHKLNFS